MKSLKIDDFITLLEEHVGKHQGLVEISAGIVPDVKQKVLDSLLEKILGSSLDFLISGA